MKKGDRIIVINLNAEGIYLGLHNRTVIVEHWLGIIKTKGNNIKSIKHGEKRD